MYRINRVEKLVVIDHRVVGKVQRIDGGLDGFPVDVFDGLREELDACRDGAAGVKLPSSMLKTISRIRKELGKKGITPSDRRYKQSVSLLKARAYLDDRDEVSEDDLRRALARVQEITDDFVKKTDVLIAAKEKEILSL